MNNHVSCCHTLFTLPWRVPSVNHSNENLQMQTNSTKQQWKFLCKHGPKTLESKPKEENWKTNKSGFWPPEMHGTCGSCFGDLLLWENQQWQQKPSDKPTKCIHEEDLLQHGELNQSHCQWHQPASKCLSEPFETTCKELWSFHPKWRHQNWNLQ